MTKAITLQGNETGYWFISANRRLWLPNGSVPFGTANYFNLIGKQAQRLGIWKDEIAWLICEDRNKDMSTIRSLLNVEDDSLFLMAGKATQLAEFYQSHQFCGYCGHKMIHSETEWCCLCSHCTERYYPQLSPSIIVAIRHNNKILLAKHLRHSKENLYTVIAGFTEVGETIEQTVKREVYEETKINIKNIRYVTSQPWPFPNSIMLAFLADYESGEIDVDTTELEEAHWYHFNELPKIPEYGTVARRLIEETIVLCRDYEED